MYTHTHTHTYIYGQLSIQIQILYEKEPIRRHCKYKLCIYMCIHTYTYIYVCGCRSRADLLRSMQYGLKRNNHFTILGTGLESDVHVAGRIFRTRPGFNWTLLRSELVECFQALLGGSTGLDRWGYNCHHKALFPNSLYTLTTNSGPVPSKRSQNLQAFDQTNNSRPGLHARPGAERRDVQYVFYTVNYVVSHIRVLYIVHCDIVQ